MANDSVSMNSTKSEILKAYKDAKAATDAKAEASLNPVKVKALRRKKEIIEKVKPLSIDAVQKSIETLRSRTSSVLDTLRDELTGELNKLSDLEEVISLREQEAEEVFGIEHEASTLAALVEAQHVRQINFDANLIKKQFDFDEQMVIARKVWNQEKSDYVLQVNREKETWKYDFERNQQVSNDQLSDELATDRKKWKFEIETQSKILDTRHEDLVKTETELKDLREKATQASANIEAAREDGKKKAVVSFAIEKNAISKTNDAELRVFQGQITSLTNENNRLGEQVSSLQTKLDDAYRQVQDVAVQALQSQGNANTIAALQQQNAGHNKTNR